MNKIGKCCFCNKVLHSIHDSNNAMPVRNDRCCHRCNKEIVIPERIKLIYGYYM